MFRAFLTWQSECCISNHIDPTGKLICVCRVMSSNPVVNPIEGQPQAGHSLAQSQEMSRSRTEAVSFQEGQPLQLSLCTGLVELSVNTGDGSGVRNRDDRELMIRCGAALFHLKLALQRLGRLRRVQLFPDLDRIALVARVFCDFGNDTGAQKLALLEAISSSQPESVSAGAALVSEPILARLTSAGMGDKAWLDFSRSECSRERLRAVVEPERQQSRVGRSMDKELVAQVAAAGPTRLAAPGALKHPRLAQWARLFLGASQRSGDSSTFAIESGARAPEQMAALAVLKTKTDDRHGWMAAGEVLASVRLEARKLDVSSQVFEQTFQKKQTREELRTIIGRKGFVQAIMGFGSQPVRCPATLAPGHPEASTSVNQAAA